MKNFENIFEKFLWNSRYFVILAVIVSIVAAIVLILIGTIDVGYGIIKAFKVNSADIYKLYRKDFLSTAISAVDYFLIATVLLIFGKGLYELFISKINIPNEEREISRILIIKSLDDLKDKFTKLIVLVLMVSFFNFAIFYNYESVTDLLYLAAGILLLSVSSYFLYLSSKKGDSNK